MKTLQLALGAAALAIGTFAQAGSLVPNKTIDIAFVGYCDGMNLTINHSTGLVTGQSTGCLSDPANGVVGGLSKIGAGVAVMAVQFSVPLLFVIDDAGKNWVIYNAAGGVVNSGTYTVGVPTFVPGQSRSVGPASGQ